VDGEERIVESLGRLHGKLDAQGGKLDTLQREVGLTREEAAKTRAQVEGQADWIRGIEKRHGGEIAENRREIGCVRVDLAKVTKVQEVETTQRHGALSAEAAHALLNPTPAPLRTPSLRASAAETVELVKWKAITAIGVPLALAIAGWIAYLTR
jgi:hypothetical protein